jgi:hypothetical protein
MWHGHLGRVLLIHGLEARATFGTPFDFAQGKLRVSLQYVDRILPSEPVPACSLNRQCLPDLLNTARLHPFVVTGSTG